MKCSIIISVFLLALAPAHGATTLKLRGASTEVPEATEAAEVPVAAEEAAPAAEEDEAQFEPAVAKLEDTAVLASEGEESENQVEESADDKEVQEVQEKDEGVLDPMQSHDDDEQGVEADDQASLLQKDDDGEDSKEDSKEESEDEGADELTEESLNLAYKKQQEQEAAWRAEEEKDILDLTKEDEADTKAADEDEDKENEMDDEVLGEGPEYEGAAAHDEAPPAELASKLEEEEEEEPNEVMEFTQIGSKVKQEPMDEAEEGVEDDADNLGESEMDESLNFAADDEAEEGTESQTDVDEEEDQDMDEDVDMEGADEPVGEEDATLAEDLKDTEELDQYDGPVAGALAEEEPQQLDTAEETTA